MTIDQVTTRMLDEAVHGYVTDFESSEYETALSQRRTAFVKRCAASTELMEFAHIMLQQMVGGVLIETALLTFLAIGVEVGMKLAQEPVQ